MLHHLSGWVPHSWIGRIGCVLALALTPSVDAVAQTAELTSGGGLDVRLFRQPIDSKGYLALNGTDVLGHKDYSFGLILDLGSDILPYQGFTYNPDVSIGGGLASSPEMLERNKHLVARAFTGTLSFNYGLLNRFVLGGQLPIQVLSGPKTVIPNLYNDVALPSGLNAQGIGDLVLHAKARLLRAEYDPLGVALTLQLGLPTGNTAAFSGEPGISVWPSLAVEWMPVSRFRVGLNAGYRFNASPGATVRLNARSDPLALVPPVSPPPPYCQAQPATGVVTNATCPSLPMGGDEIRYDDLITFGLATSLRIGGPLELVGEAYGAQVMGAFGQRGGLGVEALGGIKVFVERNSYLTLAGGAEVQQGVNTAELRAVLGFVFEPSIGDRDGDGYKDDVDQCPDEPEDFDGFEDAEGCPDPDNDRDGLLDVDDECPLIPEDHDGDADHDGCPEESLGDRDGDGILDNADECPDDPEDRDGFEDENGCPDPDNDKDGILDSDDMCPDDPEDIDQFEDDNGCPDLDNDQDRILDRDDECPNDPETYNGTADEDGCPDEGSVIVEEDQIVVLDKIYFATNSAEILPRSFPILDAVAATLQGNPQLRLVEVQGHADERASDAYNIKLTRARAASVVDALLSRRIMPDRLRSAGYGERCPVDAGHDPAAWEKNRRVEFKILRTDMGETGVEIACPAGRDLIPE